jgi:DNA (cytosine-5)-methyltransferase 1
VRVLDLFCGAGGAAMGLHQAWPDAEIVGVDIKPQPRYPFIFIEADWKRPNHSEFDFIWASPPCQFASECGHAKHRHHNFIPEVRECLREKPHVIENVDGARDHLRRPFMLCGTMFGLPIWRHRWFEIEGFQIEPLRTPCNHTGHPTLICGSGHGRGEAKVERMKEAMRVPWMKVRHEVRQAIPPAFSRYIAEQWSKSHE